MVIAIDGPAGAGKSTLARAVARELGFTYLDSGALYRCVGLLTLRAPDAAPAQLAAAARIELAPAGAITLDGEDVSSAIRAPEVSEAASRAAADEGVRKALLASQRELLRHGDWVAEGRDIGTVVAPDAELKVFLTAEPAERARRRARELGVAPEAVLAELHTRDLRDSSREHGPLAAAEDAVGLDTTGLSPERAAAAVVALARERSPGL
jgi:cytidylate kinase